MRRKIPTVNIPAAAYDEALAFCNARRAEFGRKPIKAMPPGLSADSGSCPCSRAAGPGLYVYGSTWHWGIGGSRHNGPIAFVRAFDSAVPVNVLTRPVRTP